MRSLAAPLCALAVAVLAGCGDDADEPDAATRAATTVPDPTGEPDAPGDTGITDGSVGSDGPTSTAHQPGDTASPTATDEQRYPDVVGVEATRGDGAWTFSVTISSPYDSPERYADAWRVVGPDGSVYGERILAHHHAGEQPFTRSQSGIVIPDDVDTVLVEARDLVYGWGGGVMAYDLPRDG